MKIHLFDNTPPDQDTGWIDINLPWYNKKKISFISHYLNRPGVLIELQQPGVQNDGKPYTIYKYLIGHTNGCMLNICDCCSFEDETIVLRAKILIKGI